METFKLSIVVLYKSDLRFCVTGETEGNCQKQTIFRQKKNDIFLINAQLKAKRAAVRMGSPLNMLTVPLMTVVKRSLMGLWRPGEHVYLVKSARLNCIWFQPSSRRIGIVQINGFTLKLKKMRKTFLILNFAIHLYPSGPGVRGKQIGNEIMLF